MSIGLVEIGAYLQRTGMSERAFGIGAMNDGHYLARLRKGQSITDYASARLLAFMLDNPGGMLPEGAKPRVKEVRDRTSEGVGADWDRNSAIKAASRRLRDECIYLFSRHADKHGCSLREAARAHLKPEGGPTVEPRVVRALTSIRPDPTQSLIGSSGAMLS